MGRQGDFQMCSTFGSGGLQGRLIKPVLVALLSTPRWETVCLQRRTRTRRRFLPDEINGVALLSCWRLYFAVWMRGARPVRLHQQCRPPIPYKPHPSETVPTIAVQFGFVRSRPTTRCYPLVLPQNTPPLLSSHLPRPIL